MTSNEELAAAVRDAAGHGAGPDPAERAALAAVTDPHLLQRIGQTLAGLDGDLPGRPTVRVAVLGTSTTGGYEPMLRAALAAAGVAPVITAGDYNALERSLATRQYPGDGDPDVVSCVLDSSYFLPGDWDPLAVDDLGQHLQDRLAGLRDLLLAAAAGSAATFVVHTVPLPAEVRDSVIDWRARARLARHWHQLNADLLGLAEETPQIAVADLVSVLAGTGPAHDDRLHRYADLPYTPAAQLALAQEVRRLVQARAGLSRKVLALDLDNTLWGGVLGEVGAAGVELGGLYPGNCYSQLQRAARRLRDQGVILVLLSKNDAEPVREAVDGHPGMLLRMKDFSATGIGWGPKIGGLRQAAEALGVAPGSFVFLDDSAAERGEIASAEPEVAVLAADGDPARLVSTVLGHGWFDVPQLTGTDRQRPGLYRTRALRSEFEGGFGSSQDYLRALDITLTAEEASDFSVGRIAQLAARTNQFNLTGRRFSEAETRELAASPDHLVASFAVQDKFGDDGIVGAVWADRGPDRWRVTNLVLSCRVIGRGVELAIAGWLARQAREAGAATVAGSFVPSGRNSMAADFWTRAGFRPDGEAAAGDDGQPFVLGPDDQVDEPDWITVREPAAHTS